MSFAKAEEIWKAAAGLQAVDGLYVSESFLHTLVEERRAECFSLEADQVSCRIAEELMDERFEFSPSFLQEIHGRLFQDVMEDAGSFRKKNIMKKEDVLHGESVIYVPWDLIEESLQYDFDRFDDHVMSFTAGIWQIHPFAEGNTRTAAVFLIKWLWQKNHCLNLSVFERESLFFRNALVKANAIGDWEDLRWFCHQLDICFSDFE